MRIIEELSKHHFISVPLPLQKNDFDRAATAFLHFLEIVPDSTKRTLHFTSPFERGSADGYTDKRDIEGKDSKEFFHYIPRIEKYDAYQAVYDTHPAARTFFDEAKSIYTHVEQVVLAFLKEELDEYYDSCVEEGRLANATLRFLCYSNNNIEAFNAKAHYDKGIGTFALAESSPGLRIGCCDAHPLTTVVHRNGTALFMPADLLFEDSKRTIIPAWHDVVTKPDIEPVNDRCERWAIVFFVNDKSGRYSSWDAVHTPLPVHKTN